MKRNSTWITGILCAAVMASAAVFSGCQVSIAGKTLPSAFYHKDDIEYYRKGPDFKLQREAAALKAAQADATGGQ